jgi:CrcB protein
MSDHDRLDRHHPNRGRPQPWVHHDQGLPIDPDLSPEDPGEPAARHHPIPHVHRARQLTVLAAIAAGGFIGAWGRYELELAWKTRSGHLPWATLAINTSGAFLLGLILTIVLKRSKPGTWLRPFLCVGVLGAWTTMSTFAVETDLLVKDGHLAAAVGYTAATVVAGLAFTWAGIAAGRALTTGKGQRWAWR